MAGRGCPETRDSRTRLIMSLSAVFGSFIGISGRSIRILLVASALLSRVIRLGLPVELASARREHPLQTVLHLLEGIEARSRTRFLAARMAFVVDQSDVDPM